MIIGIISDSDESTPPQISKYQEWLLFFQKKAPPLHVHTNQKVISTWCLSNIEGDTVLEGFTRAVVDACDVLFVLSQPSQFRGPGHPPSTVALHAVKHANHAFMSFLPAGDIICSEDPATLPRADRKVSPAAETQGQLDAILGTQGGKRHVDSTEVNKVGAGHIRLDRSEQPNRPLGDHPVFEKVAELPPPETPPTGDPDGPEH